MEPSQALFQGAQAYEFLTLVYTVGFKYIIPVL